MTLSAAQLEQMRAVHADLMGDTCQIGTYADGTADAFGHVPGAYTYAAAIDCGFERKGVGESHTAIMTAVNADAMLRVPHDTVIATRDRVKLTERYGTDITDEVYEVVGIAQRGPTATLVLLRQVTT